MSLRGAPWFIARTIMALVLVQLAACAHDPYDVVVVDANDLGTSTHQSSYTVKQGDTLYSIAFRYGSSVYALARENSLAEPYLLSVGQKLRVGKAAPRRSPIRPISAVKRPTVAAGVAKKTAPQSVSKTAAKAAPKRPRKSTSVKAKEWGWIAPSKAPFGRSFSPGGDIHKGVDFSAAAGSDVVAARSGKVVYAGNGLKAYGLLIIIKHDAHYLSAYAYNQRMLVKEGDSVAQGAKIATVGKKGDKSLLHFEIRKNGKPIDPKTKLKKQ